jgi:MoaA/NifB/PqqE/SkfB family radical SAM enzyme
MTPKKALTNGVFCPIPWTGLMYNHDGTVKNCIRSAGPMGNIKNQSIDNILTQGVNRLTQSNMLSDQPGPNCYTCYDIENGKKRFDIISDRIFYMRELKKVPFEIYSLGNHDLRVVDVRWSNLCNFSCVYCGPEFSSRWSAELGIKPLVPSEQQLIDFKKYIFDRAHQLQHVYMAGGEPLLMKENLEFLDLLAQVNPDVNLRINTNLSKVDTKVFDKICKFKNVHWTVSVESIGEEFEYIRYGGSWTDFLENLESIQKLNHKITFNMLWFLLNHHSIFDCIDFFLDKGFHPNSFVAGALLTPLYLNIRQLPDSALDNLRGILDHRIASGPGYLLEDSLKNMRLYIDQNFEKTPTASITKLNEMDTRRKLDSRAVFPDLYQILQG